MKAKRPGYLTYMEIIAAIMATLMIVVSASASGGSMFSPGDLNAKSGNLLGGVTSHAEIAENCSTCHTAPWNTETMDDHCLVCHVDVAVELISPESVHGGMMQIDPNAKCRTCHPEHKGADALLTVIEGWQFPHDVSRFKLNSHQLTAEKEPFLCADCHGDDITTFDIFTCTECHGHMDMAFLINHHVAFGESCLECHDGVDRFGRDFDHNKFAFELNGQHASVECSKCHVMATTVAALQATSQACVSCHQKDDPHQGSLGPDCASCHSPDGWKPSTFDHDRSNFKLDGAHVRVACEQCHMNGVFLGTPQDCFSCHKQNDPHAGQFGTTCEKCHSTDAWKPALFDHNLTGFKLIGSHVNVDCNSCHVNGIFAATPSDCFSCHASQDAHQGQFGSNCGACHQSTKWSNAAFDHNATSFPLIGNHMSVSCLTCHKNGVFTGTSQDCFSCHAKEDSHMGQLGTNCATCHVPTGWNNSIFDHNTSAFPLTGKHAQVTCTQCHSSGQFKIPTNCNSCHAEPAFHIGAFGTDCVQCHTTDGWSSAPFIGIHFTALGQNFLDHHGATCKTCHTSIVHEYTCLACHESDPLLSQGGTPMPTATRTSNKSNVITSAAPSNIKKGHTSQVTVSLNDIPTQGYTSTEFTCTYDPAHVEVGSISVGNLFGIDAVLGMSEPRNGSFILAIAGSNGQRALNSGVAFTFQVQGMQAGETVVECKARVSEGLNTLQSVNSSPSNITIAEAIPTSTTEPTLASITGQVLTSKRVTVQLYNADNSIAATTTANPDGTFNINPPEGTYTIVASAEGFLSVQGSVTVTNGKFTSKPTVSLIAGDIDNNGFVDQIDALTIRMNYNSATPTAADLNNDGVINVLDLGLLAENYGQSGPQLWP